MRISSGIFDTDNPPEDMAIIMPDLGQTGVPPEKAGTWGPKELTILSFTAAMLPFEPVLEKRRLFMTVDGDSTRRRFLGKKQTLESMYRRPLLDGSYFRPNVARIPKPLLLGVADLVAYCTAHVKCYKSFNRRTDLERLYKIFHVTESFSQAP